MAGFGSIAPYYDPATGLPMTQPEEPAAGTPPAEPSQQGGLSRALRRLTGTQFGEPRFQLWPEKVARSAFTLPHDVYTGEVPTYETNQVTGEQQISRELLERAQDLAGVAGGGMMFGSLARPAVETGVRVLGRQVLEDSASHGAPLAALEQGKALAVERRNKGFATGKPAAGWDFKRPDPEPGSFDALYQQARDAYRMQDQGPASPFLTPADHAFINSGKFYEDAATPGAPLAALEHGNSPRNVNWGNIETAERSLSPEAARALDSWVGGTVDTMAQMEKGHHPGFGIFNRNALQKNPAALNEISASFQPLRDQLKAEHGDTVTLHRYRGDIPENAKPHDLLSFTTDKNIAEGLSGARKEVPLVPESEIATREAELEKTGRTQISKNTWLEKKSEKIWNGKEEVPIDYIAIMRPDGMVTDTPSVREYFSDENKWRQEGLDARKKALGKVSSYEIPVDDIVGATNRFGQKEFIVRNSKGLFEDAATPGAPLSALERAAKQGYNIDAFHGTSAPPFEAFKRKPNDIGIHFGTADQASDRMSYMSDQRKGDQHIYPVKLKINNPLRLPDIGGWGSENLQNALYNLGRDEKTGKWVFDPEELRKAAFGPGNEAGRTKAIRDLIESKGYDGIVYKNTGETGGSEPYRQAVAEARSKLDEAFGKKKYSFTPEEQKNPAYREWLKANASYDRHRQENAQDSYIAFHPHQVRSRFAEFDPKDAKKGGLLLEDAATPGAPLAAAEAAAREHPAKPYHGLLDQPAGGAYDAPHAPETAAAREAAPAPAGSPGGDVARGAGGGNASLSEAQAAAARRAGAVTPLEGLPTKAMKIGDEHFVPGPIESVHQAASDYMAGRELPSYHKIPTKYHPLDEEHSKAIARAFDEMPHAPNDPATKASYEALIKETADQYQAIKKSGLKIEPIPPDMPDPYAANPRLAAKDVGDNNHLWFFPTEGGFGSGAAAEAAHPMLAKTGEKIGDRELLANDMFRIVHDYFGHLKEGHGFRAGGEDNAWRSHAAMYSDLARPAMTTETRGQNSWVNYGPHGEANRKASAADTVYADQKVGLMPEWTMRDRGSPEPTIAYHGSPYSFDKFDPSKIGAGEGNQSYGHGLYFAEHEPVSEWYRHQLSARRDPILERHNLDSEEGADVGVRLAHAKGDPQAVIGDLEKEIKSLRSDGDTSKGTQNMIARRRSMVNYLKDPERASGKLYQVAIDAAPEKFLEWDKRLNEQTPEVQAGIKHAMGIDYFGDFDPAKSERAWKEFQNASGKTAVRQGFIASDDKMVADRLRAGGVPGIRYLDQGSRGSGKGTANYVAFDAPRILKRYAVPGLIGAGGFGALARKDEQ